MDFCICIQLGCSNKYSQEGNGSVHVCPRCHNASVTATKETKCLQICCIDLIPLGTKHLWMCSICQWQATGPAPPLAGSGPPQGQYPQHGQSFPQQQMPYPPQPYGQPQQSYEQPQQSYEHDQHRQNQQQQYQNEYQQNQGMNMQQGHNGQPGYNPGYGK